jgi:hypothetical protein
VKGGGNAFAALTVGSRRFVKQSTLCATFSFLYEENDNDR